MLFQRCNVASRSSSSISTTAILSAARAVAGNSGRGDLYGENPLKIVSRKSGLGIHRGLTHSSQSTQPMDGQLHIRKRILHELRNGRRSGSQLYQPANASWATLVPSLCRGAEAAIPMTLWEKLNMLEQQNSCDRSNKEGGNCYCETLSVTEQRVLCDGQRVFCYELQRRLPILEDSLADAELKFLVEWPWLLHRAWIRIPHTGEVATDVLQTESLSIMKSSSEANVYQKSPYTWDRPTNHSGTNHDFPVALVQRLSELSTHVQQCVNTDFTARNAHTQSRSRRAQAEGGALEAAWWREVAWQKW